MNHKDQSKKYYLKNKSIYVLKNTHIRNKKLKLKFLFTTKDIKFSLSLCKFLSLEASMK